MCLPIALTVALFVRTAQHRCDNRRDLLNSGTTVDRRIRSTEPNGRRRCGLGVLTNYLAVPFGGNTRCCVLPIDCHADVLPPTNRRAVLQLFPMFVLLPTRHLPSATPFGMNDTRFAFFAPPERLVPPSASLSVFAYLPHSAQPSPDYLYNSMCLIPTRLPLQPASYPFYHAACPSIPACHHATLRYLYACVAGYATLRFVVAPFPTFYRLLRCSGLPTQHPFATLPLTLFRLR